MSDGRTVEVLVVEDSRTQAAQLELMLHETGFAARVTGSLAEAALALESRRADVTLLDLELPDATGIDAVARLSARFADVPIVVLTSRAEDEHALDALSQGAEDYLQKDWLEVTLLARTLRFAIERHRLRNALASATDELRRKNAELEALHAKKDQLLAVVAHDLRNPLGVVRGYADFLLAGVTGELSAEQEDIVRTVRRTADYMVHFVHDLLDFSRIQAGALELERTATDLGALVSEVVRVENVLAQQKEIRIEVVRADAVPPAMLDEHKIRQVLENLLGNAVKFSHRGSTVGVTLALEGAEAHLVVEDRGVGIPAGELDRVFQPFQKTGARPTGGERSTGLGLAIVRNIVEAHGGRIWVQSEVDRGSTFHVRVPLLPPHAAGTA